MKTFTIIDNAVYAVKNAGYKLDTNSKTETDFDGLYGGMTWAERENQIDNLIDSFCDLDLPFLCEDENGEHYAVYFNFENGKPTIWHKVVRA